MLVKHGGKVVGELVGGAYITSRDPDIHYARKYGGYGIQLDIFRNDITPNAQVILIKLNGGGQLWSSVQDWLKYGRVGCLNPRDGDQIFLEEFRFRRK